VRGIHDALDDPSVWKVVCLKSAQVAWTDGCLNNYLGRRIHVDACPMIVMFPKEGAAKEYVDEKFVPLVEATPVLAERVPVHKKRDRDNRWAFKQFAGGFVKFVGSNSPSSVKSTPAPVVCVEEPDDCAENLREQGDTITLLEERTKTYPRRKVIFGGTPTIEGVSRIDAAYRQSDQRRFYVPCNSCREWQVLRWEHVRWMSDAAVAHEIFGRAMPSSARYVCPHCGAAWTDAEKQRIVAQGEWRAEAPFAGVAGFAINELYSSFAGSTLERLTEKWLVAQHAMRQGDDTKLRSFVNNTEGRPYAYASDLPDAEKLAATRGRDYGERTVPAGGLLLTMGVDVQHDRLAVVVRAWGRGEESWLVLFAELYGTVNERDGDAWRQLDALLAAEYRHESGAGLRVRAVSIDSSDGQTNDAVYGWVRARKGRQPLVMAIKGARSPEAEIFRKPSESIDANAANTKALKYGLRIHQVGTQRAKDLLLGGRLKLAGDGPGRFHVYREVRGDYWEQLTAEVKVPARGSAKLLWQVRAGRRNEALDAEVYALHAARALKTHLLTADQWTQHEAALKQAPLFAEEGAPKRDEVLAEPPPVPASAPERPAAAGPRWAPRKPGGWVTNW
jgi:phage terminase large subunit GpA-like protein